MYMPRNSRKTQLSCFVQPSSEDLQEVMSFPIPPRPRRRMSDFDVKEEVELSRTLALSEAGQKDGRRPPATPRTQGGFGQSGIAP